MRDTLSYTTVIHGQEVTVTRHQPSNGKGLSQRADDADNPRRKKVANKPVDDQLHALDMLLESAQDQGEDHIVDDIQNSINKRIRELTGK